MFPALKLIQGCMQTTNSFYIRSTKIFCVFQTHKNVNSLTAADEYDRQSGTITFLWWDGADWQINSITVRLLTFKWVCLSLLRLCLNPRLKGYIYAYMGNINIYSTATLFGGVLIQLLFSPFVHCVLLQQAHKNALPKCAVEIGLMHPQRVWKSNKGGVT